MTETVELPVYEGLPELSKFILEIEDKLSEPQWFLELEEALKATLARWWVTHKKSIAGWSQCRILMTVHFGDAKVYHAGRYDGWNSLGDHLIECQTLWASRPKDEWVHSFVHTLDEIPRSWYVSAELRREITTWEELTVFFTHTFSFVDSNPYFHYALQLIRDVVLKVVSIAYLGDPHVVNDGML